MRLGKMIVVLSFCFIVCACSRSSTPSKTHLQTVDLKSSINTLQYTGIIEPLHAKAIVSPADGVIVSMPFQYGDVVQSNQLLFSLSSPKFLNDYKNALLQYIKSKNEFENAQAQLKEATFLHNNLLISDDDFKNRQTNFYNMQLSFVQAKDVLDQFLNQLPKNNNDPAKLSLEKISDITKALHLSADETQLLLDAPAKGVVLAPLLEEDNHKKWMIGDTVKQGDVLAFIGDANGFSVRVSVSELVVNQLQLKQRVTITGAAFPDDVVQGEIIRIDRQGERANGASPVFSVVIATSALTPSEQQRIHIGMSAVVTISMTNEMTMMIPLSAIFDKEGAPYVKRYNQKKIKPIC